MKNMSLASSVMIAAFLTDVRDDPSARIIRAFQSTKCDFQTETHSHKFYKCRNTRVKYEIRHENILSGETFKIIFLSF
jgi:hypothetical protein